MKKLSKKQDEQIRSYLDKHSTKEKPVGVIIEKTSSRQWVRCRLEDIPNFPSRKRRKRKLQD